MEYVEMMRARRVLTWYTVVVLAVLAIIAASFLAGHGQVKGAAAFPLGEVFLGSAMGAFVVATILSTALVTESPTLPIVWTRPISRARTAWRYIAVDVAAIGLAYVVLVVAAIACLAMFGILGSARITSTTWTSLAVAFGSAVMWYALTLAASSRLGAHGARIAGFSWLVFLAVGTLWAAPFPAPIHALLTVLNYLNPLAYINGVSVETQPHTGSHPIMFGHVARIALEYGIAAVATVAAVRLWSTREV